MTASLWPSLLAFVGVIALIPFALALLKRMQTMRPTQHGPLAIVAGLQLGTRERIAIVRAGEKWLVVGVTPQAISLLATLDELPAGLAAATNPAPFAKLFAGMLKSDANRTT